MDLSLISNTSSNFDDARRKMCVLLLSTAANIIAREIQANSTKKDGRKRRKRRWWKRSIYTRQPGQSEYFNLYKEMQYEDPHVFFHFTRMTKEMFDELLGLVGVYLTKRSNRPTVPPDCRLLLTLRLLASGDTLQTVALAFRLGKSTVCNIFRETCAILWKILQPIYLPQPTEQKWKKISKEFEMTWQLPNCVGALDGREIDIKQPNKSYNKAFSMIFFGVADAKSKFLLVDIGSYDFYTSGGIFKGSQLGQALNSNKLNLPPDQRLPGTNNQFPYFFYAGDAFPLQSNLLRSFPKKNLNESMRIYNYRLSKAMRCIENAFGILAARWHIFHKSVYAFPDTADKILQATIGLHNFIMTKEEQLQKSMYCNDQFIDREVNNKIIPGLWRNEVPGRHAFEPIKRRLGARNACHSAMKCRELYMNYVNPQIKQVYSMEIKKEIMG